MANPNPEPDLPEVEAEFEDPNPDELVGEYIDDPTVAEEDK